MRVRDRPHAETEDRICGWADNVTVIGMPFVRRPASQRQRIRIVTCCNYEQHAPAQRDLIQLTREDAELRSLARCGDAQREVPIYLLQSERQLPQRIKLSTQAFGMVSGEVRESLMTPVEGGRLSGAAERDSRIRFLPSCHAFWMRRLR